MRWLVLASALLMTGFTQAMAAPQPLRLQCSLEGKAVAAWKVSDGRYRVRIDGEWSDVPADAVGPMLILLQFGGAPCAIVKRAPK